MTKYFNIEIDNMTLDNNLIMSNNCATIESEIKSLGTKMLKLYDQKMNEYLKISKMVQEIKNNVQLKREKLKSIIEKVESSQQSLQTENEHFEAVVEECKHLEIEKKKLLNLIAQRKEELNLISKDKKEIIKNLKKEIKSFNTGVTIYERFTQLDMKISYKEKFNSIEIYVKNMHNHNVYTAIFEEDNNTYHFLNISPRNEVIIKAEKLYKQNQDVQGLLAYLSMSKQLAG